MKRKMVALALLASLMALCLGCEEGPAEKAGKKLDKLGREAGDKAGDLVDSMKEKFSR